MVIISDPTLKQCGRARWVGTTHKPRRRESGQHPVHGLHRGGRQLAPHAGEDVLSAGVRGILEHSEHG